MAVLPVYNVTNDVEGPQAVRAIAEKRIRGIHYKSIPLNEVDNILRDRMGITLGSQLSLTSPQDIGNTLGVDAVLYGYLLDYEVQTAGVYNVNRVRAGFRLVDTKTGGVIWSRGQGVKSEIISGRAGVGVSILEDIKDIKVGEQYKSIQGLSEIPGISDWRIISIVHTKSAENAGLLSLGEKIVTKTFGVYLRPETDAMMDMVFRHFPAGPGAPREARLPPKAATEVRYEPRSSVIFEYLWLSGRDFTSDVVMRSFRKANNEETVLNGKLARGGENFMAGLDLPHAYIKDRGEGVLKGPSKLVLIRKAGQNSFYVVYPEFKKYVERTPFRLKAFISAEKLGEEVLDGHKCEKYRTVVTSADGGAHEWFLWKAKDLDGFVIKAVFEDRYSREILEIKEVRAGAPAAESFEVPGEYTRAADSMDVINEKR